MMCELLKVSRSGFYAWRQRPMSARAQQDQSLQTLIISIHQRSQGTYGAPRIMRELRLAHEIRVSEKRVARLMKQQGLVGEMRRKFVVTTRREKRHRPAPDQVQRCFKAAAPDQLWVADITHVPTTQGAAYLAVVLDVFSRKIVGWALESHMESSLVKQALKMAMSQRRAQAVIHHSDQGSQYTCLEFGALCRKLGVSQSMGSVGDCYDHAMCESFFATLECELFKRVKFREQEHASTQIVSFIEGWYNTRRRHSSLGYVSPVEFERLHFMRLETLAA